MTSKPTRAAVDDFLAQDVLALAGASRGGKKFGSVILRELLGKGYRVHPLHPEATELEGRTAYRALADLPEPVGGLVLVVPKPQAAALVGEAAKAGIARVWLQQGAESPEAEALAKEKGLAYVGGECLLMFLRDTGFLHRAHRWVNGVFGRLPA